MIGLEGYIPTCGDLEHMSAYFSALVNTLLVIESAWVIRSWKIVHLGLDLVWIKPITQNAVKQETFHIYIKFISV